MGLTVEESQWVKLEQSASTCAGYFGTLSTSGFCQRNPFIQRPVLSFHFLTGYHCNVDCWSLWKAAAAHHYLMPDSVTVSTVKDLRSLDSPCLVHSSLRRKSPQHFAWNTRLIDVDSACCEHSRLPRDTAGDSLKWHVKNVLLSICPYTCTWVIFLYRLPW